VQGGGRGGTVCFGLNTSSFGVINMLWSGWQGLLGLHSSGFGVINTLWSG
jgi:predicted outer membrane lipoprotein